MSGRNKLIRSVLSRGQRLASSVSAPSVNSMGFVLPIVCIVILFLTFQAYTFTELMLVENIASVANEKSRIATSLSDSGIVYATSRVTTHGRDDSVLAATNEWSGRLSSSKRFGDGDFDILGFNAVTQQWRWGVVDETSKLNLNELPLDSEHALEARRMLLCMPMITPRLADAILDWLDADDEPRPLGAEAAYYSSLQKGATARNRPLDHLSDLLGVRGMSEEILFGSDRESVWVKNPSEQAEGWKIQRQISRENISLEEIGLEHFLTVYGGASFVTDQGDERIVINNPDLVALFDSVETKFGEEVATYVVAYRLYGPQDKSDLPADNFLIDEVESARRRGERQAGLSLDDDGTEEEERTRGILKIKSSGDFKVRSIYDLIGVPVKLPKEYNFEELNSPWKNSGKNYPRLVPVLQSVFSFYDATPINVKVNVNLSPVNVLNAIPGIEDGLADHIVKMRSKLMVTTNLDDPKARVSYSSIDWLRAEGVLTMEQLRTYAPYMTVKGNAFRFLSRGRLMSTGEVFCQQVVIDTRQFPPQICYCRPTATQASGLAMGND